MPARASRITATMARLQDIIAKSLQKIREGRGISHEDFWAEFPESAPPEPKGRRKGRNGKAAAEARGRTKSRRSAR